MAPNFAVEAASWPLEGEGVEEEHDLDWEPLAVEPMESQPQMLPEAHPPPGAPVPIRTYPCHENVSY